MDIYTIYKATNLINGKSYIGFTSKTLEIRKTNHKNASKRKTTKFYNAIKKYGWENFNWETLYISKDKEFTQNIMETYFIKFYNSFENGYNMTIGGEGITNPSLETRQKIAKANSTRIITEEAKRKNSNSSKGILHTQATKEKIRIKALGRIPPKFNCQFCNKQISLGPMKRFHGENCKHKIMV